MSGNNENQLGAESAKYQQPELRKILVVEDSPTQRDFISALLKNQGFEVTETENGADAKLAVSKNEFEVVLLDIGLPDIDGIELCKLIKADHQVPVIIVSGHGEPLDRIVGLGAGADDYIVKPFEPLELLLRVEAMGRRGNVETDTSLKPAEVTFGDITLNQFTRSVEVAGAETPLTKIEFEVLRSLMNADTAVVSRADLATNIWGSAEWLGDGHALNVHVANLKKKLKVSQSVQIDPVRGVGYRIVEKVST